VLKANGEGAGWAKMLETGRWGEKTLVRAGAAAAAAVGVAAVSAKPRRVSRMMALGVIVSATGRLMSRVLKLLSCSS